MLSKCLCLNLTNKTSSQSDGRPRSWASCFLLTVSQCNGESWARSCYLQRWAGKMSSSIFISQTVLALIMDINEASGPTHPPATLGVGSNSNLKINKDLLWVFSLVHDDVLQWYRVGLCIIEGGGVYDPHCSPPPGGWLKCFSFMLSGLPPEPSIFIYSQVFVMKRWTFCQWRSNAGLPRQPQPDLLATEHLYRQFKALLTGTSANRQLLFHLA